MYIVRYPYRCSQYMALVFYALLSIHFLNEAIHVFIPDIHNIQCGYIFSNIYQLFVS